MSVFPLSTIRIAHILAQTHPSTMKSTIVPSELCDALVEACSTYKANHKTQTPFLGALNVITSLASPHSTQLSKQSVKELIRLLRSKFSDLDATVQLIHLCARLLSNPVTRTDLIDQGLLQVISKTVYQQPKLKNSAAVAQILHNIAHELDASRNLSILEALSNLSEQVSTSDMHC
ncbi:TPA: hypothetical protein N0F65_007215 [Lagenidium giganteum]|uniref:Uncharacterized protein n=1 Tax=Lagenidium giganteum TaxID=4803 RepID=A0AAV2Z4V3_9STRA|nr:TPA: hypothetical protein N0F65_007215 [Lagenidium giganteum]